MSTTTETREERRVREATANHAAAIELREGITSLNGSLWPNNPESTEAFHREVTSLLSGIHTLVRDDEAERNKAIADRDGESRARTAVLDNKGTFGMFTAAGARSVRNRLATLAKRVHTGDIADRAHLDIEAALTVAAIGRNPNMGEVHDTAVREAIAHYLDLMADDQWGRHIGYHEWDL